MTSIETLKLGVHHINIGQEDSSVTIRSQNVVGMLYETLRTLHELILLAHFAK